LGSQAKAPKGLTLGRFGGFSLGEEGESKTLASKFLVQVIRGPEKKPYHNTEW